MSPPLVSVMIPSLWRFDGLMRAIRSFRDTADDPKRIQMLIRLHYSDTASMARAIEFEEFEKAFWSFEVIAGSYKPKGAENDWLWNELKRLAVGTWHQYWSDDQTIEGKGWDSQLSTFAELDSLVVNPEGHRLNLQLYHYDKCHPTPFVRARDIAGPLPGVPDAWVYQHLILDGGFNTITLPGITTNHQRDENDPTLKNTPYADT